MNRIGRPSSRPPSAVQHRGIASWLVTVKWPIHSTGAEPVAALGWPSTGYTRKSELWRGYRRAAFRFPSVICAPGFGFKARPMRTVPAAAGARLFDGKVLDHRVPAVAVCVLRTLLTLTRFREQL